MRTLRPIAVLSVSALLLATAGCLKEKTTITVYPDGSGKIEIKQSFGKQASDMMLMMAQDDEKKQAAADMALHKKLSSFEGVCAWTSVKAAISDDGKVTGT